MSCEYCKGGEIKEAEYCDDGEYITLLSKSAKIYKDADGKPKLSIAYEERESKYFWGSEACYIDYCPWCGEKLSKEGDD